MILIELIRYGTCYVIFDVCETMSGKESGKEIKVEGVINDSGSDDGGDEPIRKPNPERKRYLMKKLGMITDDDEEVQAKEQVKASNGQVPDKYLKNLTDEDRAIIIKNYADGIQNDNYDVRILKGGSPSITRKRGGKPKTIDDEILREVGKTRGSVGNLTTEQFMIKNFIDLESKFSKLKSKQKRLKKKYRKIKGDIYVNDEEVGDTTPLNVINDIVKDKDEVIEEPVVEPVVDQAQLMKNDENASGGAINQGYDQVERAQYINYGRKMNLRERLLLQRGML